MAAAAVSSSSSSAFIKGSDVPKILHKWLLHLAEEEKANNEREKIVMNVDLPKVIVRELIKRGMGAHTRVSKAIERFRDDQRRLGDTPELAAVLKELPTQWKTYSILLQQAAEGYFTHHSVQIPNFTQQYFEQITFITLWNEVWTKHFHISSGGESLKLLSDIHNELISVSDMNSREKADASKPLVRPPQDFFNFSQAELESVTATALNVAEQQQQEENTILAEMKAAMEETFEYYNVLSGIYVDVFAVTEAEKNNEGFVVENVDNVAIADIRLVMKQFLDKVRSMPPNTLESEQTHTKMRDHSRQLVNDEWLKFQTELEKPEWQEAYRNYVLAYTDWTKALKMLRLFETINKRDEEAELYNVIPFPKEMREMIPNSMDNKLIHQLHRDMEIAREASSESEVNVRQHGLFRDRARYIMDVEEKLRQVAVLKGSRDDLLLAIDNAEIEINARIEVDCVQSFASGDHIGCRAMLAMRKKKEEIRKALYSNQSIGHTYKRDEKTQHAARICQDLQKYIEDAMEQERSVQLTIKKKALRIQRTPGSSVLLSSTELMKRPLMSTYVRQAKQALEPVWKKVTSIDLELLASEQMSEADPSVALEPMETSLMQLYARQNQPSTFGEIVRFAMWMMWALHKDAVNTAKVPLTTEA